MVPALLQFRHRSTLTRDRCFDAALPKSSTAVLSDRAEAKSKWYNEVVGRAFTAHAAR